MRYILSLSTCLLYRLLAADLWTKAVVSNKLNYVMSMPFLKPTGFIFSLVNVQRKISTGLKLLQYYTTKDWDFRNERFQELSNTLNETDERLFDTSVSQVNWDVYISDYIRGMRTYILGESDDTLPYAKKVLRRLYILDCVSKILLYTVTFWFLWTHLDGLVEKSDVFIRSSLYIIYNEQNTTVHT